MGLVIVMRYGKHGITPIELAVLRLLGKGLDPARIAEAKGLEPGAVTRAMADLAERLEVGKGQLPEVWQAWVKGRMGKLRSKAKRFPKHLRNEFLRDAV
jgi:DNA-binding NarL/FixJ family response regulator